MHVDRAEPRYGEHKTRKDLPVRHHDQEIWSQLPQPFDRLRVTDPLGLVDGQAELDRGELDRRWFYPHTVTRPVRLSDHEQDLVPRAAQCSQRRHGKPGRAGKDDLEGSISPKPRRWPNTYMRRRDFRLLS